MKEMRQHNPVHPGKVLRSYIEGHTVGAVATHIGVSRVTMTRILGGKAGVTAEMSIKLGEALGTSSDFWFKMQNNYDFWVASQTERKRIGRLRDGGLVTS